MPSQQPKGKKMSSGRGRKIKKFWKKPKATMSGGNKCINTLNYNAGKEISRLVQQSVVNQGRWSKDLMQELASALVVVRAQW